MKYTAYASTLLPLLAAARPDNNNDGFGGWQFAGVPSCADSCKQDGVDYRPNRFCSNNDDTTALSTCINNSSCSDEDKATALRSVAQLCANRDATITAAPYATFSVTAGQPAVGSWGAGWSSWANQQSVEWSSWADAHDSAWSSWTSAATFTAWPTDQAQWDSLTSAHPLPSGAPVGVGWHGGNGPFGPNGRGGDGWGFGPWAKNGSWTTGAWTNWWGTPACPPSTWTGWTEGTWTANAPWTTWAACSAETTATSVYTTTVTENGTTTATVATSYGYGRVAEATTTGDSTTTTDSGAKQTQFAIAGSAAGVFGILAGAALL